MVMYSWSFTFQNRPCVDLFLHVYKFHYSILAMDNSWGIIRSYLLLIIVKMIYHVHLLIYMTEWCIKKTPILTLSYICTVYNYKYKVDQKWLYL